MKKKTFNLLPETGEPTVSIHNLIHLSSLHGDIVGAIHQVSQTKTAFLHSTLFFFIDGFAYECLGFEIGTKEEKTLLLKSALQKIPFVGMMIEGDEIANPSYLVWDCTLPNQEEPGQARSLCHIFRPPEKILSIFPIVRDSEGLKIIESYIKQLDSEHYEKVEKW